MRSEMTYHVTNKRFVSRLWKIMGEKKTHKQQMCIVFVNF